MTRLMRQGSKSLAPQAQVRLDCYVRDAGYTGYSDKLATGIGDSEACHSECVPLSDI